MGNFLKPMVNRAWKIAAMAVALTLTFLITSVAIVIIPTATDAKRYLHQIHTGAQIEPARQTSAILADDVDSVFSRLNNPVVKKILRTTGLEFSDIAPEIRALILSGPQLAGISRPRKYLLAFQNSAEARGTGGILGAYALVVLDKGRLSVERTGSNVGLKSLEEIPIPMPVEYGELYRSDPAIWQNSNLSPHFPYGAKIWMALWDRQYNEKLDGVIAVDPTALSYILNAVGAITLASGEKIDAGNIVYKTLSEAYKRFEKDNTARKQYLVEIMNATFAKIASGDFSKIKLAIALRKGVLENRVLIYANDPTIAKNIKPTRIAGDLTAQAANEYRVVIENIDASKLDYYLDRKISVSTISCLDPRTTQITVVVKNTLKSGVGLPAYVLTRADKTKPIGIIPGQHRFLVFIYGPSGSTLINAKRSSSFGSAGGVGTELNRPVLVSDVDLSPLASEKITATFSGGSGAITFHEQPLVRKISLTLSDRCKG